MTAALIASTSSCQVVFVDGNGILHPRGFGLASHLGVLVDVPTVRVNVLSSL